MQYKTPGAHHAALSTLHTLLGPLRNPLVCAIPGTEVQNGGPVVGEILGELATGASRKLRDIVCGNVHRYIEGVLRLVSKTIA
jgi:hypothetical protein